MLTELKNRGVADALIVCCDGLKGLPDAIRTTWPEATVQTCVVHMVRNSLRYASKQHWGQITGQMRAIYTAPTVEAAEVRFAEFADAWRETYPAMISSWENAWREFVPFLEFPAELRKIVYTTNAIESLNARFRRAVRHRGHFPNEQAALSRLVRPAHRYCRGVRDGLVVTGDHDPHASMVRLDFDFVVDGIVEGHVRIDPQQHVERVAYHGVVGNRSKFPNDLCSLGR